MNPESVLESGKLGGGGGRGIPEWSGESGKYRGKNGGERGLEGGCGTEIPKGVGRTKIKIPG